VEDLQHLLAELQDFVLFLSWLSEMITNYTIAVTLRCDVLLYTLPLSSPSAEDEREEEEGEEEAEPRLCGVGSEKEQVEPKRHRN
jgi:hypothetical protein